MVKYLFKLASSENSILQTISTSLKENPSNWTRVIKRLLEKNGLGYKWLNLSLTSPRIYKGLYTSLTSPEEYTRVFRGRQEDNYIAQWRTILGDSSPLYLYKEYKTNLKMAEYLRKLPNDNYRKALCQSSVIMKGDVTNPTSGWNRISLKALGKYADATFNDASLFHIKIPDTPRHGFVGLGTSSWGYADFDNMLIQPANWTTPLSAADLLSQKSKKSFQ